MILSFGPPLLSMTIMGYKESLQFGESQSLRHGGASSPGEPVPAGQW